MDTRRRMPAAHAFTHFAQVGAVLLGLSLVAFLVVLLVQSVSSYLGIEPTFVVTLAPCALVGWVLYALFIWRLPPRSGYGYVVKAISASYLAIGGVALVMTGGTGYTFLLLAWGLFTMVGGPIVVAVVTAVFVRRSIRAVTGSARRRT